MQAGEGNFEQVGEEICRTVCRSPQHSGTVVLNIAQNLKLKRSKNFGIFSSFIIIKNNKLRLNVMKSSWKVGCVNTVLASGVSDCLSPSSEIDVYPFIMFSHHESLKLYVKCE